MFVMGGSESQRRARASSTAEEEQRLLEANGGDSDAMEHAFMHREGLFSQDELEDATEREEVENDDETNDEEEQPEFISRIYNFYIFPGGGSERELTLSPSTVKFLLQNNIRYGL